MRSMHTILCIVYEAVLYFIADSNILQVYISTLMLVFIM